MKLITGFRITRNPIDSKIVEIKYLYGKWINSNFFDEIYTEMVKIITKIGGGIFINLQITKS